MSRRAHDRDPKAVALGRRIAAAMQQKDYTQDQLAVMLNVTRGAVGQWVIGASTPRPKVFPALAEVLGVSTRWLLTGNEPDAEVRAQTDAARKALALIHEMTPQQQQAALAMLAAFQAGITKK